MMTTPQGLQANSLASAGECLSPSDMQRPASEFSADQRRQIVACMARQLNPQLPRQIDPVTRLDRLSTEGPMLVYHYTILRAASSLPANAAEQLEAMTRRAACAQPQMRQTLQLGGAYGYRWVDNQGVPIHRLRIDAC